MRKFWVLLFIGCLAGKLYAALPGAGDEKDTRRDTLMPVTARFFSDTTYRDTLFPLVLPYEIPQDSSRKSMSVVFLPDSLIRDTLRYEYTKIKQIAYKNRLTRELYHLVFVNPNRGQLNVMRTQNSEDRFAAYRGRKIQNIDIKVLPPYGTSVYDTTYFEEDMGWLKTIANKTHMKTAVSTIRKQLTLYPGMRLNPFEVVQNEILLRELDYIEDVNITIAPDPRDSSYVNLTITCKDELSWGAELNSNFLNSFDIELENKNFMKLGHVLNYEFSYRGKKDKRWGNILEYKVNSLGGSHINVRGYYRNDYREKQVRAELSREFLTVSMKWAGGISAGRVFYSDDLPDRNVTRLEELFDYHFQDVWGGRSFQLAPRYSYNQNLYVTGRFFTTLFNRRPYVSNDTNHFYYNRLNYFLALTYVKIKYYKANLIYDFGRTEDIPSGLYLGWIGGFENNEFMNSGYLGTEGRYSFFDPHKERYYAVLGAIGSYLNKNGFERGFVKVGASHISNLCSWGTFKFRFYNDLKYVRGIRRYAEDYLYMENTDIRGFDSDTLRGNQKISLAVATTFFMPYIKRGFRASFTAFVDVGTIAPLHQKLFDSKTYWGIGVALNLRNDNVVLKNLSIRLAFYPNIPEDGRKFEANLSGRSSGGFMDYRVSRPQVLEYR